MTKIKKSESSVSGTVHSYTCLPDPVLSYIDDKSVETKSFNAIGMITTHRKKRGYCSIKMTIFSISVPLGVFPRMFEK